MPSAVRSAEPSAAPTSGTFRTLLASEFVSLIGDRLVMVALITLVYDLTGSPFVVALLLLAKAVPSVFLGGLAGAVVDRVDRKTVMVTANLLQGLVVLLIPATRNVAVIVAVYLLMSVINQFFLPARSATIPDLVSADSLTRANALFGMAFVGAIAVGPALGGWVADAYGLNAAFYVDSVTFLVPAVAVATLRLPPAPARTTALRSSLWDDTRAGLRHAAADARTRSALAALAGTALVIAVMSVLGVVVAQDTLGLGVAGYGVMMSSMGAGMLVIALALGRGRGGRHERTLPIGLGLAGGAVGVLPGLTSLAPALVVSALMGAGVLLVQISAQTTLQSSAADVRGRVLGLGQTVTGVAQLAAIAATALLAGPLGSGWVLSLTGGVAVATAVLLLRSVPGRSAS